MPQRFLRPGITNSSLWNAVEPQAANLFVRLLTLVDDFGRTDGRSSVVLGHCFSVWNELNPKRPVKLQQVAEMLQQLMDVKLIDIYELDGKRVIQIEQWQERIREGCKSKWPAKTELAASCSKLLPSSPSPTSSPTPVSRRHSSNGSQANTSEPSDAEWIGELIKSTAYQGIDVPREFAKMQMWCKTAKKQPSRRRFINWLNKCERPLNGTSPKRPASPPKPQPEGWEAWRREHYPEAKQTDYWRVPGDVQAEFRKKYSGEKGAE